MQRREPGAKTTEVEARVALVCASTDDGRPLRQGFGGTDELRLQCFGYAVRRGVYVQMRRYKFNMDGGRLTGSPAFRWWALIHKRHL